MFFYFIFIQELRKSRCHIWRVRDHYSFEFKKGHPNPLRKCPLKPILSLRELMFTYSWSLGTILKAPGVYHSKQTFMERDGDTTT